MLGSNVYLRKVIRKALKTDCGRDDWQGLQSRCKYSSSPQLCVHQENGKGYSVFRRHLGQ